MILQLNGILSEAHKALEAGDMDKARAAIQDAMELALKLAIAQKIQDDLRQAMARRVIAQVV